MRFALSSLLTCFVGQLLAAQTFALCCVLLFTSASALRSPNAIDNAVPFAKPLSVPVPWKWCGNSSYDSAISNKTANKWPPATGDLFAMTISVTLRTAVTNDTFTSATSINGTALSIPQHALDELAPLPWRVGSVTLSFDAPIPYDVQWADYAVAFTAVDQDGNGLFCFTQRFYEGSSSTGSGGGERQLGRAGDKAARYRKLTARLR